jgi:hypothetical protein
MAMPVFLDDKKAPSALEVSSRPEQGGDGTILMCGKAPPASGARIAFHYALADFCHACSLSGSTPPAHYNTPIGASYRLVTSDYPPSAREIPFSIGSAA